MMITVFMIMVPVLLAFAWGLFLGYSVGKIDGETKAGKDGLK